MHLKENVKLAELINKAKMCSGDVFYKTTEGDVLNLKSFLTQMLLQSIANSDSSILVSGQVICDEKEDCVHFTEYAK